MKACIISIQEQIFGMKACIISMKERIISFQEDIESIHLRIIPIHLFLSIQKQAHTPKHKVAFDYSQTP